MAGPNGSGVLNPILVERLDESPAIVYVKDLDGRYLRINRRYTELLDATEAELSGRTDYELGAREAIDGPRLADGGPAADEPLQLEYTIGPFEGRPALAVWRFPVHGPGGEPVAVCGVAAPIPEAAVARGECGRLMEIERSSIGPVVAESAIDERRIAQLHEASAAAAKRAHQLVNELTVEREARELAERALVAARARVAELERALARLVEREPIAASRPTWDALAQLALTEAIAGASDWRTGVKDAVNVLGPACGWDAICAWRPDPRDGLLHCFSMWTADPDSMDEFETATWQRPQQPSSTELGDALTTPGLRWMTADPDARDPRLSAVARQGMSTVVVVPVRSGAVPVALLELMARAPISHDRALAATLEAIALQLGHFGHLLSAGAQPTWRLGRL